MNEPASRPDPDRLLQQVQRAEARAGRGKLKIFFGFAPGVGKTYRMLQVARDLVADQQVDVVVGIVEDHRRFDTARMLLGLELLPRRRVEHRGHTLTDLDLDRALRRKPQLVLVDELAHTNAPGLRHAKRHQDVEELLAAGIDVFTTLNVQHIESLNDVVAQITGVQVRETVPDAVLDAADALELVDVAPEELLERLRDGKVYLGEQAERASQHFFQRGNLLALRELALRRTAAHVDEDVLEYREAHGVKSTWPAGERILVCVGAAPSSARLVRSAARMAAGLRCPWLACYVESTSGRPHADADLERIEQHLRLAESLGAETLRLASVNVGGSLLEHARKRNVTRLVIGKPTHSRLRDLLRGSLVDDIVRGSGDIDVHVISGDDAGRSAPTVPSDRGAPRLHYIAAALIVGVTLALSTLLRGALDLPDLEMLFLLAVMITAVKFGRGPSTLAAGLGVACYDFFFVLPYHTFSVADQRYFLTFAMMFGVGFVMSELAERLRRQERDAHTREGRTAVLYALTRELSATSQAHEIAGVAARHAAGIFSADGVLLVPDEQGELHVLGRAPESATIEAKALGVARFCHDHGALSGLGTDTLPGAGVLCAPLRAGSASLGVLALRPHDGQALSGAQRTFFDVLCRQIAAALERARLADEAERAALVARTEELRSSLLSAVSHDLRTPLATITGAATSLRDDIQLEEATRRELVESIVDQAERLERLVGNLLDMTRLESGAIQLKRDWVPLDEMIGSALTRLEPRLGDRPIRVEIAESVPLLFVDPVLFEQVFVNLLENADKYTPPGSALEITASATDTGTQIQLRDHGPGLPAAAGPRLFEKFYRGAHTGVAGAGLGLAICKGIVEAHGGQISARNQPGGGATFSIDLPRANLPAPSLADETSA